jgi:hypothetical protein
MLLSSHLPKDYMIGDYAISKRALTRAVKDAFSNKNLCSDGGDMDKEFSYCMAHFNVMKVDGIDRTGRGMFFQNSVESALFPTKFDEYGDTPALASKLFSSSF